MNHKFTSLESAKAFALAGNALLTLESLKSGKHVTYKVRASKDGNVNFVSVLTDGSADQGNFVYLGIIGKDGQFKLTAKSFYKEGTPAAAAFGYFWGLSSAQGIPAQLVIRHEGHCGKCGKTLTVPASIDSGIGPECAKKMAAMGLN